MDVCAAVAFAPRKPREIATRPFRSSPVACGAAPRLAARAAAPTCRKIEIHPMITHRMPLADINKAFDLMHQGKSIRSVVVY